MLIIRERKKEQKNHHLSVMYDKEISEANCLLL